jgi:hypothetical protein
MKKTRSQKSRATVPLNKRECHYVTRTTAYSSLIFFRQNTPCDGTSTGQAIPLFRKKLPTKFLVVTMW